MTYLIDGSKAINFTTLLNKGTCLRCSARIGVIKHLSAEDLVLPDQALHDLRWGEIPA